MRARTSVTCIDVQEYSLYPDYFMPRLYIRMHVRQTLVKFIVNIACTVGLASMIPTEE